MNTTSTQFPNDTMPLLGEPTVVLLDKVFVLLIDAKANSACVVFQFFLTLCLMLHNNYNNFIRIDQDLLYSEFFFIHFKHFSQVRFRSIDYWLYINYSLLKGVWLENHPASFPLSPQSHRKYLGRSWLYNFILPLTCLRIKSWLQWNFL